MTSVVMPMMAGIAVRRNEDTAPARPDRSPGYDRPMSTRTVIIALILAVALAAAGLLLLHEPPHPAGGPALGVEAPRIREVRIEREGGRYESARRGGSPGDWQVVLGGPGVERTWPADPARVRSVLRILSTLEFSRPAARGDELSADAAVVRILCDDGREQTLRVSPRALAGEVFIDVRKAGSVAAAASGWIGADVREMLIGTGPREWRDPSALNVGAETSRVFLRGTSGTVALARVQGRWALREPVQEAAEPEAIAKLSNTLSGLLITDFLDAGAPADSGVEQPVAEIIVEADVRDADSAPTRVARQALRVGRGTDLTGKGVYASVERAGQTRTIVLSTTALAALNTDAGTYISGRAMNGATADVGKLVVTPAGRSPRTYQRTLDGWTSGDSPVAHEEVARIDGALKLLSDEKAQTIAIGSDWPSAWPREGLQRTAGTIELQSAGGMPMGVFSISAVSLDGTTPRRAVQSGSVWRVYGPSAGTDVPEWLSR
jgi:hypothetical protein